MVDARPAEINDPWLATPQRMVEEQPNSNRWQSARKGVRGEQAEADIMNNLSVTDSNFPPLRR